MQIAQTLSGYTLGGADLLRRAMGKKKPEEMARAALDVRRRRGRARRHRGARGIHLRPDREVRGLRLQQVALGRLCAARLPDRLAEGAPPGGVHGGRAVLRHGAHGQGGLVHRRVLGHSASRSSRPTSTRRASPSPSRARARSATGSARSRAWARARWRRSSASASAAASSATSLDLCRRVDLKLAGKRTLEAMLKAGCFDRFGRTRAALAAVLPAAIQLGEQRTRAHAAGQDDLFGGLAGPAAADERVDDRDPRAAGMERARAARRRARDARPVPDRPPDRGTRAGTAPGRAGAHRGPRRPAACRRAALRRRQERHRRGPRAGDAPARLAHDAGARRPQRAHRGEPVRRRLAAAPRDHRARRDPRGRRPAALRRVHRRLAHQREEADARSTSCASARRAGSSSACLGAGDGRLIGRLEDILRTGRGGRCAVSLHYIGGEARGTMTLDESWAVRPSRRSWTSSRDSSAATACASDTGRGPTDQPPRDMPRALGRTGALARSAGT